MTAEVIWFFGQSGAGKKTAIEALESDVELRVLAGVSAPLLVLRESIDWVLSPAMPERRKALVTIVEEVACRQRGAAIILKGQLCDLENQLPILTRDRLPIIPHRIVFITADPAEVHKRWQTRGSSQPREDVEIERRGQEEHMRQLKRAGFAIAGIEATTRPWRKATLPFLES